MSSKIIVVFLLILAVVAVFAYTLSLSMAAQPTIQSEEVIQDSDTMPPQGKLNIVEICQGALMYMTFTDGAAADAFVQECIEGKYPDVVERYKEQMGIDSDVAI